MTNIANPQVKPATLKESIPSVSTNVVPELERILSPVKQNIEVITGQRAGVPKLVQLPATATLAQVITTLNTVIQRLNQTGQ